MGNRALHRSRPRWTSLARSHPYGNGGIPTELDYTGFDAEATRKQFAEIDREMALHGLEPQFLSYWALVLSTDLIQWKNNLFQASAANGYSWNLRGINVVRMAERTARRAIEETTESLYVVEVGEGTSEGRSEVLAVGVEGRDEGSERYDLILTFERKEEVGRFVQLLEAEGCVARERLMGISELNKKCKERGVLLGVVPCSALISPLQFEGMSL